MVDMYYAQIDTINDTAEYWGIIDGLRRAEAKQLTPLYVVDDSTIIIEKVRMHRPTSQPRVRKLYLRTSRCADSLEICGWTHHYRAHNNMAELASCFAMYSRASQQTCDTENCSLLVFLKRYLPSDVQP